MSFRVSLFQRNLKSLVWAVFALLALLPLLTLIKLGILLLQSPTGPILDFQLLALGSFMVISLCGGLFILLKVAQNFQELSEKYSPIGKSAPIHHENGRAAFGTVRTISVQNELASLTDVLTRVQAEFLHNLDTLREQASFLENLQCVLNRSSDMVIIMDDKNSVIFSNHAAREKLGLLPDCTVRRSLEEGLLSAPDSARMVAIFESWDGRDEDLTFTRSDGGWLMVHCLQNVVEFPGQTRSKIVILRDLTENKRMLAQLYRSEHLVSLGQLISGIAHDLNNPLAAIIGFTELCRDASLSREDLTRNLEIIEREANRSAHIIENLLNFSRRRSPKKSAADIHDLLERCLTLLSYFFRIGNITVRRDYGNGLPLPEIDEYQIQQVLMNLLVNAAQALKEANVPEPLITVKTALQVDTRSVRIQISDNGLGIPPEILPRIFEPFFSTRREDQGTGLGLTVARDIILQHQGLLTVESRQHELTTFSVVLPVAAETPVDDHDPALEPLAHPLCVLLVEEDPAVMKMIRQALVTGGHSILTAPNLVAAQPLLGKSHHDVLILDIARTAGECLQESEKWISRNLDQHIHIVLITDGADTAEVLRKKFNHKVQYLIKPFQVDSLYAAILRHKRTIQAGV